ncbi:MAG: nucleotidyltransferase family protein, partial [Actinobacteria bacterium]|nr:nucleotidyltransferase family protein [Actinomycetota bacterium]
GLKFAAKRLADTNGRWMALNGDVISRFKVKELEGQHERLGVIATIALAAYRTTWGIADLEGDLIRGFTQSPTLPYWINAGIYCFESEVIEMLPDKGDHEDSTFPELATQGKLGAYRIDGYWRGIDTAKDIKEATAEIGSQ